MTEHLDRGKYMTFAEIEQAIKEAVDAEREACIEICKTFENIDYDNIALRCIGEIEARSKE